MKTAMRRMLVLAGTTLVSLPAWADVPAALDRVPTDALVVAAIKDLEQFDSRAAKMMAELKIKNDDTPLGMASKLMKTPGLNTKGSIAMALMPDEHAKAKAGEKKPEGKDDMDADEEGSDEKGPIVLVIPVSDPAAFCKAFGGEFGKGVIELKGGQGEDSPFEGPAYAKDLGGGYLAVSQHKELVEKFDGAAGRMPAHKAAMGAVGGRIADTADTIVVANMQALGPKMKEGFDAAKGQMEMMLMMGGQKDAEKMMQFWQGVFDGYSRDAQTSIVGLGLDDGGVWLDLSTQFKEGSESFKLCQTKGKAPSISAKLPDQPYLAAFSVDVSGPNMKQVMRELAKFSEGKSTASILDNFTKGVDKLEGVGVVIGQTAGMMAGGLLANGSVYVQTTDPAGYAAMMRDGITSMNGKTENGMTFKTSYEQAKTEINGVKVDQYSAQMTIDPNAENAMQAQQGVMMMYGPAGGPAGYLATLDNAVVMTMAQNTPLMTMALDAAKGKKGLGENSDFKTAGSKLQADRSMEGYLNVKPIMDMIAMFTGGGANVPATLPPIGLGASNGEGAGHVRLYVPKPVIAAIKEMAGGGAEGGDEDGAPAEKGGKPPRF